ncbi:MAG: PAS domain S-box protein [Desulfuromonadaceae bacterium]|nr:PAS domain S-box protein [Desulfuromonadaceae bacterium]
MTLSQRTILIIVSTFIALLFILAVTSDIILLKSFTSLERVVVADNVQKVRNEIEEGYDEILASSHDFCRIIAAHGASSLNTIPASSLVSRHVDLVICFSDDKKVLSSLVVKRDSSNGAVYTAQTFEQLGEIIPLVNKASQEPLTGLVMVDGTPTLLSITPIADKHVLLMAGRYLDAEEINRITALTEFVFDLVPVSDGNNPHEISAALTSIAHGDENPVQVINKDTVAGYTLFKDIFDRPAFFAKITEERLLYKQGKASIIYVLSSLFVAGGVFCCVMLFFIRGTILNRLAALTQKMSVITSQSDIAGRLPVSEHQDELRDLAVSINCMLESLETAEKGVRESEERYRMLFERAPDAIIIIGLDGDEAGLVVAANQAAADQHGYSLDELCRLSIYELNTPETNKIAGDIFAKILGGEWVTAELWHQKKDGSQFPIEIHAGLIKINGKKYVLGFDRDITQRKITEETDQLHLEEVRQLNEELSRKAIDLAASNNELETFNYSVSHDMRGPLTRISGYCQLLLEDEDIVLDDYVREYISRIYESEKWLNDMIDALLHLAQLSRVEIISDCVDLSKIAEETLHELILENPDRPVKINIEPDVIVSGDPCLLKVCMINLLNNAWKYSSLKSVTEIDFGIDRNGPNRIYYVRDNGAGFDMKDAWKLFRVFTRLHDSSQFAGTGIGLATVQRIIFRHGGHLWTEAEVGVGATFFFTLP